MDTYRALQVDAFTDEPLAGNPAGVLPDAAGLTDEQMQQVARELAVSETAFVLPSDEADYRLRYFTPTQEVDLCGHATVGAFGHLHEDGAIDAGEYTVETNVGVLDVAIDADGTVWLTQDTPHVREVEPTYERVAEALGVDVASLKDVGADLPLAVASTGVRYLLVPVNFLEHLGNADPDLAAVEALTDEFDALGVYPFTFDAIGADATLHARMFAPGAGVPEDPVCGTGAGAVTAYLDHYGAFADEFPEEVVVEQGHYVDRPGRVRARVDPVAVGGRSVTVLDGSLVVPDAEEDEILEV
ncbi:PhzF family phenazine biosynthesis protein [Haloarchaeobius sp. DYHT-AS-18]|uniref:PhzF family phenazine biosynthesis protein n=1 Tax=Haloarchaeobius sp. DYHT-AS-18 TaxID=3446117 RepID=UPI003EBE56CC